MSRIEVGRAEDSPTECNETECNQPRDGDCQEVVGNEAKYGLEDFVDSESDAVQSSPNEKHQGTAVPDARSKHRDKQTETSTQNPIPITSERDVEIVSEPGGE